MTQTVLRWPRVSLVDLVRIMHLLALVIVYVRTCYPGEIEGAGQ